jgi:hypothetical protein
VKLVDFLQQSRALFVVPRVLHDCAHAVREEYRDVFVLLREQRSAYLFREVEIAERAPTSHDRHAEEGVHWGMVRRKTVGVGMPGQVRQPDGTCLPDYQPEDAVPSRRRTDPGAQLVIDPVGREALQQAAVRCQHAYRCVVRADQLGRRADDLLQNTVDGYFRDQGGSGDDEALQALLGQCGWRRFDGGHPDNLPPAWGS